MVTVSLQPHVGDHAEIALQHCHPISENNGFTAEIFMSRMSADDRFVVGKLLNAGAAFNLVQRDERADRIEGLSLGADDYITKPFDIEELKLRVVNAINRQERENSLDPRTGLPSGRQDVDRLRGRVEEVGKTLSTLGVSITNLPNGGLDLVSFNTSVESVQALRKQLLGILEILQPTQTLLLKRITPAGRPQDVDRLRQISPEQKEALIGNIRKIVDELEKLVPIQSEIRQSVDRTR